MLKAGAGKSWLGGEGDRRISHGHWIPPRAFLDGWGGWDRCEGGLQGGELVGPYNTG